MTIMIEAEHILSASTPGAFSREQPIPAALPDATA
jgi:hypothetical protein